MAGAKNSAGSNTSTKCVKKLWSRLKKSTDARRYNGVPCPTMPRNMGEGISKYLQKIAGRCRRSSVILLTEEEKKNRYLYSDPNGSHASL